MGLGQTMGNVSRWSLRVIATVVLVNATAIAAYPQASVRIDGAGATSLTPLFEAYVEAYAAERGVLVSYTGIGSGGGVRNLLSGTIDFIGTDFPLTEIELATLPQGAISVPIAISAIALVYNLPDVPDLKLSRDTYTDIFLGEITDWNDPRIAADNPGVRLPELPIRLVVRADASGESLVLVDHLNSVDPEIGDRLEVSATPAWIGSLDYARGNQEMIREVQRTEGTLGYLDYAYTLNHPLEVVSLQNPNGEFVEPSITTATQALDPIASLDNIQDLLYPRNGYPIVDVKWISLYRRYSDDETAEAIRQFVSWMLGEGQTLNNELGYVRLPESVAQRIQNTVQMGIGVDPVADQLLLISTPVNKPGM